MNPEIFAIIAIVALLWWRSHIVFKADVRAIVTVGRISSHLLNQCTTLAEIDAAAEEAGRLFAIVKPSIPKTLLFTVDLTKWNFHQFYPEIHAKEQDLLTAQQGINT